MRKVFINDRATSFACVGTARVDLSVSLTGVLNTPHLTVRCLRIESSSLALPPHSSQTLCSQGRTEFTPRNL